jgi:hypothetical protein
MNEFEDEVLRNVEVERQRAENARERAAEKARAAYRAAIRAGVRAHLVRREEEAAAAARRETERLREELARTTERVDELTVALAEAFRSKVA